MLAVPAEAEQPRHDQLRARAVPGPIHRFLHHLQARSQISAVGGVPFDAVADRFIH